jgi:hypothetical protein
LLVLPAYSLASFIVRRPKGSKERDKHPRARAEIRKATRQFRQKAEPIELTEMPELVQAASSHHGWSPVVDHL